MGSVEVNVRTCRDNPGRVDHVMAPIIVSLDVIEVAGHCDARQLIKRLEIIEEVGIIRDATDVALEVPEVYGIKPEQRREEAPVSFSNTVSTEVGLPMQDTFPVVQGIKERSD